MSDRTHDAFSRLQNIRNLIVAQARAIRTGEADGTELDLLLRMEETVKAQFEDAYQAERAE